MDTQEKDITDLLRECVPSDGEMIPALCCEAADEIERLRGALVGFRALTVPVIDQLRFYGREGLLLAGRVHAADDAARFALSPTTPGGEDA